MAFPSLSQMWLAGFLGLQMVLFAGCGGSSGGDGSPGGNSSKETSPPTTETVATPPQAQPTAVAPTNAPPEQAVVAPEPPANTVGPSAPVAAPRLAPVAPVVTEVRPSAPVAAPRPAPVAPVVTSVRPTAPVAPPAQPPVVTTPARVQQPPVAAVPRVSGAERRAAQNIESYVAFRNGQGSQIAASEGAARLPLASAERAYYLSNQFLDAREVHFVGLRCVNREGAEDRNPSVISGLGNLLPCTDWSPQELTNSSAEGLSGRPGSLAGIRIAQAYTLDGTSRSDTRIAATRLFVNRDLRGSDLHNIGIDNNSAQLVMFTRANLMRSLLMRHCVRCSFSRANLSDIRVSESDGFGDAPTFEGSNFSDATLSNAYFPADTNFRGADFRRANLSEFNFTSVPRGSRRGNRVANFNNADFRCARLNIPILVSTRVGGRQITVQGAKISRASIVDDEGVHEEASEMTLRLAGAIIDTQPCPNLR